PISRVCQRPRTAIKTPGIGDVALPILGTAARARRAAVAAIRSRWGGALLGDGGAAVPNKIFPRYVGGAWARQPGAGGGDFAGRAAAAGRRRQPLITLFGSLGRGSYPAWGDGVDSDPVPCGINSSRAREANHARLGSRVADVGAYRHHRPGHA